MTKGQVSIEYLLITAFAFMLTIPIITMFYSQSHQLNRDVTSSQVDRISTEIVNSANEVYYQGKPSKKTIKVYFPQNIDNVTLQGKSVVFHVSTASGDYELVKTADTNLSGNIRTFSGVHNIEVEARLNDVKVTG